MLLKEPVRYKLFPAGEQRQRKILAFHMKTARPPHSSLP